MGGYYSIIPTEIKECNLNWSRDKMIEFLTLEHSNCNKYAKDPLDLLEKNIHMLPYNIKVELDEVSSLSFGLRGNYFTIPVLTYIFNS